MKLNISILSILLVLSVSASAKNKDKRKPNQVQASGGIYDSGLDTEAVKKVMQALSLATGKPDSDGPFEGNIYCNASKAEGWVCSVSPKQECK